ncbi:MAG: hypothetical protein ABI693_15810 [Bryobacteraceae bacterium]
MIYKTLIVALSGAALAVWFRYSCSLILCSEPEGLPRRVQRLMRHADRYPRILWLLRREYNRQRGARCAACGGFVGRRTAERFILALNFQYLQLRCGATGRGGAAVDEMAAILGHFEGHPDARSVNYRRY